MRKMFAIANRHTGDIAENHKGDPTIFDGKTRAILEAQVMTERSQEGGSHEEFNVVPVKVPRISSESNFFSRYAQGFASAWKNNVLGRLPSLITIVFAVLLIVFHEEGTDMDTIFLTTGLVAWITSGFWAVAFFDMPFKNESTLYQQAEVLHHAKETVEV